MLSQPIQKEEKKGVFKIDEKAIFVSDEIYSPTISFLSLYKCVWATSS
jgi:hypothetical protein